MPTSEDWDARLLEARRKYISTDSETLVPLLDLVSELFKPGSNEDVAWRKHADALTEVFNQCNDGSTRAFPEVS